MTDAPTSGATADASKRAEREDRARLAARARKIRGYMRGHEHDSLHARGVRNTRGCATEQAARPVERDVHE
jgi:hypothetical protein